MDVLLHNLIECCEYKTLSKIKNYMLTLGLFFLLYQHVQYTFIMSCGIHAPLFTLLPLDPLSPPVCRSMQVTTDTHLMGARNLHIFTDGVHSPVSRHPSIRTCEIILGLTDSSLLGSHVACSASPSTGSYIESWSTPALIVSNPHVSYTTPCEPGSKVLPYGVGEAKASTAGGWSIRWGSRPGPFAISRQCSFSSIPRFSAPRHILWSCAWLYHAPHNWSRGASLRARWHVAAHLWAGCHG